MRTPACDEVEQKIYSNFKITGADTGNLYMKCLNQPPAEYGCIDHYGANIFFNTKSTMRDMHVD